MKDKIKITDKTEWFAEELRLAELHEDFMEKYAVECSDDKGREWYGWKDVDSPQDVWEMWIEPKIKLVNVDQRVMLNFVDIKELFLMEIEKHDNIRMGAMLAKDIQAERTARENKKAIVDLFGKVKSKISA